MPILKPMPTIRPALRAYTVGGIKYIVGDVAAAREQIQAHNPEGRPPCQCFDCLAARSVLTGKVITTVHVGSTG